MANEIETALAELREMFGPTVYVRARHSGSWFAGEEQNPQILAMVQVNSAQWDATTLSEAMQKVREWKATQDGK